MRRISLCVFFLASLSASTWETPCPFNYLVNSKTLEWEKSGSGKYGFKIYSSGLANLSSFTPLDTGLPEPQSVFLMYPELIIDARVRPVELQLSGLEIVSAKGHEQVTDSIPPANFMHIYRFTGELMWQSLPWLGASAGYIHYLGYCRQEDTSTLAHASSFSIGAVFKPGKRLMLGLLTQAPAKLILKDTLILPLIVSSDAVLALTEKIDFFTKIRYSYALTNKQVPDSTSDFLAPFGIEVGADFEPISSVKLRLLGNYSASSLYPLEPLWPSQQGLTIAAECSWRKGPWIFSALLASGRHLSLEPQEGFNSSSYILRLSAAFEL